MRLITSLMWPMLRVGSFVLASPILGAKSVTVRTRVILTLAIAWILAPLTPVPEVNPLSAAGLLISLQQIALGLGMGFIFHMAFSTVVIAGQSIAMAMGLVSYRIEDGVVADPRIGLGGVEEQPRRITEAGEIVAGHRPEMTSQEYLKFMRSKYRIT